LCFVKNPILTNVFFEDRTGIEREIGRIEGESDRIEGEADRK